MKNCTFNTSLFCGMFAPLLSSPARCFPKLMSGHLSALPHCHCSHHHCHVDDQNENAVTCFSFRNSVKSTENATKYQLVVPWLKSEAWDSDLFDQRHLLKEKLLWPITSYYLPVSTGNAVATRNFLCKSGRLPRQVPRLT